MCIYRYLSQYCLNLMDRLRLAYIYKVAVTYTHAVKQKLPVNALVILLELVK